jgi:DNA-binding winged helix-turn-helix (wHTH) protein/Flp pilus assembly protein TadD
MSSVTNGLYEFGPFRLKVEQRVFTRGGQVLPLAPKTFDLLVLFIQRPGHAFSKQELMSALWPDTFVEEANLSFQISTLRKALGDGEARWIETITKHGYRFSEDVRATLAGSAAGNEARPVPQQGLQEDSRRGEETAADGERSLLKARFLMDARLAQWVEESFSLLQHAVTAVPTLASAHVAMSQWYAAAAVRNHVPYDTGFVQATRHAQEAVRLAPASAEASGALARAYYLRRLFRYADRSFQRAIELDSSASIVLGSYCELLSTLGRHAEALELIDGALSRQPASGLLQEAKACALFTARDFSRCIEWCDSARHVTPTSSELAYFSGTSLLMLGRHEEALQDFSNALAHEPNLLPVKAAMGIALHQMGHFEARNRLLQNLELQNVDPAIMAEFQAGLGKVDRALDSLDTGFRCDSPQLMGIAVNPLLDPVRGHPRFQRLVVALQLDGSAR